MLRLNDLLESRLYLVSDPRVLGLKVELSPRLVHHLDSKYAERSFRQTHELRV